MESVRIGNDISVQWAITRNGIPESLEGRNLKIEISNLYGKQDVSEYEVVGNTIRFTLLGKEQKHLGKYTLTLYENKGESGMMVVDVCDAFCLVARSCMEDNNTSNSNLEIKYAKIETDIRYVNNPRNTIVSDSINRIEVVSQDEYDRLEEPDNNTLYVIL